MTPLLTATIVIVLPWAGSLEFIAKAHEYVETHRRLAAALEQPLCADPEEQTRQAGVLAAAIRDARPLAKEGDIFTPKAAEGFRAGIADTVRRKGLNVAALVAQDDPSVEFELYVYGTLPWSTNDQRWRPVLEKLPVLPAELEYRFVGRHLALMDVAANMVVDVLRDALPADAHARGTRGMCDVHPEMPACWM